MSKPWILVSPASRGIGHALTRHLLRTTTAPILATARSDLPGVRASILDSLSSSPSTPLSKDEKTSLSKRLHLTHIDVTHEQSLTTASAEAAQLFPPETHHLHLAFALPGILHPEKSPADVDYAAALHTLQVNVLGPLMLIKHFGDFLPRKNVDISPEPLFTSPPQSPTTPNEDGEANNPPPHATFLLPSARVGSTTDNRLGGWYTYRASKAGVTSLARTYDLYLQNRSGGKAICIAYHPGTVKTDLSREFWDRVRAEKLFTPEYAAERMVEVVRTRRAGEHRGRCWDWRGVEVLP
ncbi:NAD(P)-binding protein [Annulohypoxylon maeteangense]|uniref:NAD(P)-binding protein n=1 Tax=Annulohypoxylon maeteangense TaxID=1927788 RepID=UPI002007968C|nr:NAD(P)-binding protein [Annulohypoxylon maeteangense]KAI0885958.1 NAD(P)-binding protein [Annulohypoxylon maeteangense]